MTNGFLGMVPTEVDALAAALQRHADEVEALTRTMTSSLDATSWSGDDRRAFEQQWSGELATGLRHAAESLRDAASIAAANAQQQRDASGW